MKKTLYTLLMILAVNWILTSLFLQMQVEPFSKTYFTWRSLQKALLLAVCVYLVLRSKSRPSLLANSTWALPLSFLLLGLSYYFVDSRIIVAEAIVPVSLNLMFLLSCLLVGFFEEFLFRVYVFSKLRSRLTLQGNNTFKSVMKTVFFTSFLFGISHITNAFRTGFALEGVINQIILATALGILFQALLIRFGNVIFIGVLHGLINYVGSYKSSLLSFQPEPAPFNITEFLIGLAILLSVLFFVVTPFSMWLIRPKTS